MGTRTTGLEIPHATHWYNERVFVATYQESDTHTEALKAFAGTGRSALADVTSDLPTVGTLSGYCASAVTQ